MAIVDTQRPAIEEAVRPIISRFWPSSEVFEDKAIFWLEEGDQRTRIFFSGVNQGDGIYAKIKNTPVAGFVLNDDGGDSRQLVGVDVVCGVLLRKASNTENQPRVEVVGIKFKERKDVDREEGSEPVQELVFEATKHRSTYVPI